MKRRYYFDHNASMPVEPRVLAHFVEVETRAGGNPGSLHHTGRAAAGELEEARESVAARFGLEAEQVIFCSGGTEANNLALFGLGGPGPVACARTEHASVWEAAGQRGRVEIGTDREGFALFGEFAQPDGDPTPALVAVVHGQNEVGTVQDLAGARAVADRYGALLHVDAAQTVGRLPLDELMRYADSVALSAHKFGGLRGCGLLLGPAVPQLRPMLWGGGQEFGRRPGTPSAALASSNAFALGLALDERVQRCTAMRAARDAFCAALHGFPTQLLTPVESSLPNTAMIEFEGVEGRSLLPAFDVAGVEASAGSACSSGSAEPPRVLSAMGLSSTRARCCVRFSFSHRTTVDDAEAGAGIVGDVVRRLVARAKQSAE